MPRRLLMAAALAAALMVVVIGLAIIHPAAVAAQDSVGAAINAATGDLSQRLVIDAAQIRSGSHDPVVSDAHNALISGMHDTAGATPRGIPTLFSGFASVTEFLAALDAAGLPSALQEIAVVRDGIRVSSAGRIAVDDAAIEVYQLDGPDAVAAVLDGFRGEGGVTFQLPANVTLWGSGALLVILVNAPAAPSLEADLRAILGDPALATLVGPLPPPYPSQHRLRLAVRFRL